ncbi:MULTISPECIES: hypothetical protein [Aeromonas]|uniref:hypothetical protein n=1 Tax=Aeromonas TaxID=642 RepID=UPI00111AA475|nr:MULTISPECIES: hypothetical protein [Aeromonas]MCS3790769.1 hypothetical protein [Aeromonas hydrophila]TNI11191.1 hypothetical protein CF106_15625 [Aeromonas veronii]
MNDMNIPSNEIKLAGFGNSIQWGAVIGIAIDKYMNLKTVPDDDGIRDAIRDELKSGNLDVPDIKTLPPHKIKAIDKLLKDSTVNLSSKDLEDLF